MIWMPKSDLASTRHGIAIGFGASQNPAPWTRGEGIINRLHAHAIYNLYATDDSASGQQGWDGRELRRDATLPIFHGGMHQDATAIAGRPRTVFYFFSARNYRPRPGLSYCDRLHFSILGDRAARRQQKNGSVSRSLSIC
jgi:hypothetical protein